MLSNLRSDGKYSGRVVILGGKGFIGGAIQHNLENHKVPVVGIGRPEFDLLNQGTADKLANFLKPNDTLVFVSANAPCKSMDVLIENLKMTQTVIAALKIQAISHLIYVSSDAVYKDNDQGINEDSCAEPNSIHGAMHLVREIFLKNEFSGPLGIIRPTLVYGLNDPHNGYGPNSFRRLAIENKDIVLYGQGEERRDHVYVEDIAELVRLIVLHQSTGIVNAVSGETVSFYKLAEHSLAQYKSQAKIKTQTRSGAMPHNGYRPFAASAAEVAFPGFRFRSWLDGLSAVHQDYIQK